VISRPGSSTRRRVAGEERWMPVIDQKLSSRLLRLDAASRALLLEMDSTALADELRRLHDLVVQVRAGLDRVFSA
jgi:hypothetical protein